MASITKRAAALGGVRLGFPLYIHDISLNNVFNKVCPACKNQDPGGAPASVAIPVAEC